MEFTKTSTKTKGTLVRDPVRSRGVCHLLPERGAKTARHSSETEVLVGGRAPLDATDHDRQTGEEVLRGALHRVVVAVLHDEAMDITIGDEVVVTEMVDEMIAAATTTDRESQRRDGKMSCEKKRKEQSKKQFARKKKKKIMRRVWLSSLSK
jgi:hypothetical protein